MNIEDIPNDRIVATEAEVEALGNNEIVDGEVIEDREAYDMEDVYSIDESVNPCPDLDEGGMRDEDDVIAE